MNSILAVAKNTIKQALRMKIALVFIIMLLVLLPVLGISTTGDETIKGRLQTFISYSMSLTSFLLCLLTIAISIYTVTNDIKEKQIFTVVTKPIRRFEFLTGKLARRNNTGCNFAVRIFRNNIFDCDLHAEIL